MVIDTNFDGVIIRDEADVATVLTNALALADFMRVRGREVDFVVDTKEDEDGDGDADDNIDGAEIILERLARRVWEEAEKVEVEGEADLDGTESVTSPWSLSSSSSSSSSISIAALFDDSDESIEVFACFLLALVNNDLNELESSFIFSSFNVDSKVDSDVDGGCTTFWWCDEFVSFVDEGDDLASVVESSPPNLKKEEEKRARNRIKMKNQPCIR